MNGVENEVEAVAIIGMDGRFPGAPDIDTYWKNLLEGRETIDRFDRDSLDPSIPAELRDQPEYVPVRGLMPEADRFDAGFFGISPAEAEVLDPQQRVFLEMCWRAMEDAGYAPGTHEMLTGVFGGMSNNTYFPAHVSRHPDVVARFGEIPAMVANEKDYLTTRAGYKLNLRGPCINVTTACSTALVAVCHAFNSLLDYQCDLALAGGVSILCPPRRGYLYQEGSIYSPDGHCRPFDAAASGTVFSSGGGLVVLKRLSDARRDGDTIHAVIRGAAMNNDGAGKVSFTAPSVEGQADVVQMAQELAGVHPDEIGYVEAHGTGTTLGDPIEIAALTRAFRTKTERSQYCHVGSVKGNIGHLDAAAGIAGLIKTALALREGRLPPTLHFRQPNPALNIDQSPFRIVDECRTWPEEFETRKAAVSAFGLGGTNAHAILEQPPARESESVSSRTHHLLVLSAKTEAALDRARLALADHMESNPETNLADAAFTLQVGRRAFEHRLALSAATPEQAARRLRDENVVSGRAEHERQGDAGSVFLFPGQGSQYVGMGQQIYDEEPLVRDIIDRCADAAGEDLEFDLRDVMFGRLDNANELLDETRYTQPALFALEYALAALWKHWGVRPRALIGHSIGEFAAAAHAGVFSLEDAVRVVVTRGRLMDQQPNGSMLSVQLDEEEVRSRLLPGLTLAAVNAPGMCVASGDDALLMRMKSRLDAEGVACRVLRTSHAFHSSMMDPAAAAFETFLAGIRMSPPELAVISTLTGRELAAGEATDPSYWARQLREPVRFMNALQTAVREQGGRIFMEVGPGIAASTFAERTLDEMEEGEASRIVTSLGRQRDSKTEPAALLDALGRLWTSGLTPDWQMLRDGEQRRRVPLPTYRFERDRYWLESTVAAREKALQAESANEAESREDSVPLDEQVARVLAKASGIPREKLSPRVRFTELGLDSLLLTQFSQMLRKRFGVKVKFRELLVKHNTLEAVTALARSAQPDDTPAKVASSETRPPVPKKAFPEQPRAAEPRLNAAQREWLDELSRRYTWRTSGSKAFARTHRSHLADPRAVSGFDPLLKEMVYPIVAQSSFGSRLQDVDGNRYIDLVNGFGSNLLGHSPPFVTEAIRRQLKRGYEIGPQTPLAGRVARQVQALTGFPRVSFCTTESEAIQAALRVARTATGRDRIVVFNGDYNGVFDEMLARRGPEGAAYPSSPGVPAGLLSNVEVLEYGSEAALERISQLDDSLAAILVEPVQDRHPERFSPEFLGRLREGADRNKSALIFNELVSGFRTHPGGIQGRIGLRADIAVYGKVCGGGMPLGIVAGESRFMDALDGGDWQYGDDSSPQADVTFFAETHVRHPLVLAATEATLEHLLEAGPALQQALDERTARLVNTLQSHCEETGAPISLRTFSSWFLVDIDNRVPCKELFFHRLRAGGVHAWPDRVCYLSTAHTDTDLARIARVFRESVDEMQAAGFFEALERPAPPASGKTAAVRSAEDVAAKPPHPAARLGRRPDGRPGWFVPDPERPGRYREVRTR